MSMNPTEIALTLGVVILALCSLPQALVSVKAGHARHADRDFLAVYLAGHLLFGIWAINAGPWQVIALQGINVAVLSTVVWYKVFPRRYKH